MSRTESAVRLFQLDYGRELTAAKSLVHNVHVDDIHVATIKMPDEQLDPSQSLNRSSTEQRVYRASRVHGINETHDLVMRTQVDPYLDRFLAGENVAFIFVENEGHSKFPECVQFCYCTHEQECLVEHLLEYLQRNLYDQSLSQLNAQFCVFQFARGAPGEIQRQNVIPQQPMFPSALLRNLPRMQKTALNSPSLLQLEMLTNKYAEGTVQRSTLQIVCVPKIDFNRRRAFRQTQKTMDDLHFTTAKTLKDYAAEAHPELGTRPMNLAQQIKARQCRCRYEDKSTQLLVTNL